MFPEKSPAPDGRGEIFLPLLSVYYLSLLCVVTFSCTKILWNSPFRLQSNQINGKEIIGFELKKKIII